MVGFATDRVLERTTASANVTAFPADNVLDNVASAVTSRVLPKVAAPDIVAA